MAASAPAPLPACGMMLWLGGKHKSHGRIKSVGHVARQQAKDATRASSCPSLSLTETFWLPLSKTYPCVCIRPASHLSFLVARRPPLRPLVCAARAATRTLKGKAHCPKGKERPHWQLCDREGGTQQVWEPRTPWGHAHRSCGLCEPSDSESSCKQLAREQNPVPVAHLSPPLQTLVSRDP